MGQVEPNQIKPMELGHWLRGLEKDQGDRDDQAA